MANTVPTREEYLYFSLPEKLLFYALTLLSLAFMAKQIWVRVRLWQTGRPIPWRQTRAGKAYWKPRADAVRAYIRNITSNVLAQKKVRSSRPTSGAPMHLLIFYGFVALFIATTLLGINTYSPFKFHKGTYYLVYEATFDSLGLLFIAGIAWAAVRRYASLRQDLGPAALEGTDEQRRFMAHRRRFPLSHDQVDFLILALLFSIGLTGYFVEGMRLSVNRQSWDNVSWVGMLVSRAIGEHPGAVLAYKVSWWLHAALVLSFFAVLPQLRIRHVLLAILTSADPLPDAMGKLRTIPMEEVEATEQVGAKFAKDYSRWHLMSTDACMECGRCTEVCPAWNVGKVLNPKQIVQDVRGAMLDGRSVAEAISEEALWACTTCNACVEACPVLIRHVDLIVDARRNLVSEGALAGSAATMLRQVGSTSNAWGQPASSREDWMKDLDIPLCRDGVEFEYLLWVGCAGATDPGAINTTKATAKLLKKAGVKFACLGREEACTGDPARRIGEEFLFQDKAAANVSVFERYQVKKIVTACPHCFNSFKNEYGDFGAHVEVFHHTQLLQQLVTKGQLLAATPDRGTVAIHDPCYLGRVNEEVDAPRAMLSGLAVEPEFSGKKTRCCGAGGGRMWMEEPTTQRPGNARAEQLIATGAKTVAVACPFCRIMLGDSLKQVSPTDEIRLVDLAELMQSANE